MWNSESITEFRKRVEELVEEEVDVNLLMPNPWNFNKMTAEEFKALVESLKRFGRIYPVLVRNFNGRYEIIDGEHRWRAHRALGLPRIKIKNLGSIDDALAQELTFILNETRGEPDPKKLSSLVKEFVEKEGFEQVVAKFPYNEDKIRDMLIVAETDLSSLKQQWKTKYAYKGVVSPAAKVDKCDHEWEEPVDGLRCAVCGLLVEGIDNANEEE